MKWRVIEFPNRAGEPDIRFHCEADGFIREVMVFNESMDAFVCASLSWLHENRRLALAGYQGQIYAQVQHERSLTPDPMDKAKEGA